MSLIFVSSPQEEFAEERRELCYFILTDPYLKEYFKVFLFEDLPANERTPGDNYRDMVADCDIYLGLFGRTYGTPDDAGISATEHEYDHATELGKYRIVFLKPPPPGRRRQKKMAALVARARRDVTFTTFSSIDELKLRVMQSLLYWQQTRVRGEEA